MVRSELGLDRRRQQRTTGEASEGALLVEHFAGHERQAEDLAVRMGDRGPGFASVVDDHLGVADERQRCVLGEAPLQDEHQLGGVLVVELVEAAVVIAVVDEHFVNAARLGLDVDRPQVVHRERIFAVERGISVRDDPH